MSMTTFYGENPSLSTLVQPELVPKSELRDPGLVSILTSQTRSLGILTKTHVKQVWQGFQTISNSSKFFKI